MLRMKPNCENCDADLPNESSNAMICSYECTFCSGCVSGVLNNVCPNCGGGFVKRPTRPNKDWRSGVSAAHHPPSTERIFKPVDRDAHVKFAANIQKIHPRQR